MSEANLHQLIHKLLKINVVRCDLTSKILFSRTYSFRAFEGLWKDFAFFFETVFEEEIFSAGLFFVDIRRNSVKLNNLWVRNHRSWTRVIEFCIGGQFWWVDWSLLLRKETLWQWSNLFSGIKTHLRLNSRLVGHYKNRIRGIDFCVGRQFCSLPVKNRRSRSGVPTFCVGGQFWWVAWNLLFRRKTVWK